MSRVLTASALKAMFAEETGDYPILLVTIGCESWEEDLRISSDPTQRLIETDTEILYGTRSASKDFLFLPFQLKFPDESDETSQQMSITIDNVSREMVPAIRAASLAMTVTTDIVMSCSPDIIEASFPDFTIASIEYDELTIVGNMTLDLYETEPFPGGSFTPSSFPGLF